MTVEKNPHGAWVVSEVVGGYRVSRTYYGYTKREAMRLLREEVGNGY